MAASNMQLLEDWTERDPLDRGNGQVEHETRLMVADARSMAREILRLREIERRAMDILQHVNTGDIDAHGTKACMAVIDLGEALGFPVQWRRI